MTSLSSTPHKADLSEKRRGISDAIVLTLPEPPSSNRYWRHAQGRTYLSTQAIAYRATVFGIALREVRPPRQLVGPLSITLKWYRKRAAGDLDNRLKQLFDALQGVLYEDDSQIVEIHAYRHEGKDDPRCEVTVGPA